MQVFSQRRATLGFALVIVALMLAGSPAQAAFPGANGRLSLLQREKNFGDPSEGWTMNPNGTDQRKVVPFSFLAGVVPLNTNSALRFSPDGTKVVYSWFNFDPTCGARVLQQPNRLRIANADGTGVRDLTTDLCGSALNGSITLRNDDADPAWSPDGTRVVFSSRRGCIKQRDPQCNTKREIWSVRASDGADLRQLTAGPDDHNPTWGTNGRIAFVRAGDIWTIDANGGALQQVTSGPADDTEPNWSPDGQRLVFSSNRDEPGPDCGAEGSFRCHYEIYSVNANGTGVTRLTTRPGKQDIAPVFSPDGRKIAWNGDGDYGIDVWTMNSDGTAQTDVTNATRPGGPFVCCEVNFNVIYAAPDWQPVAVPPVPVAPAIRTQMDPPGAYAGKPSALGTVFISERAPAGGTVVTLRSSHPSLASVPASVTIPAGSQSATYTATLHTPAADTTVTFTASIPGRSATTSIDLHPAPTDVNFFVSGSATSVQAGQDVVVGANLNEPAGVGGAVVTFSSDHPAVAPVPASQTYPEGIGGGGFILHAGSVTQDTLVTLTAHFGAVTHTVSFTVTPGAPPPPPPPPPPAAALASLTFTPASVQGGTSSTGVVTLTAPAPSGGLTVSLNSPSARVSVPASVTVLAGQISRSFTATTSAVTATTPVDLTASAGTKSVTGRLTLTAPTPPNADTVRVTRAQYDAAKRQLRVEATSTSTTATLTAFAEPSGARIGVLQNNGGGQYRGQFDGVDNPGTVRVTSSLGGTATLAVGGASGTVKAAPAPAAGATAPAARPTAAAVLHATPSIVLPAADPSDVTAPRIDAVRLLPARFRIGSRHGTLVSFTLGEPAKVTLSFARQRGTRFVAVPGTLTRTLPAGRVRVRFNGTFAGGRVLRPGVYRVTVSAVDASGNAGASARAVFVARRGRGVRTATR